MQKDVNTEVTCKGDLAKHTVVPLAIPITVGPGTVGALMVMGAEMKSIMDVTIGSLAFYLLSFAWVLCSISQEVLKK